jgi:hypothetical protein
MRRAAIDGGEGFARRFRDAAQHRKGPTMAPKAPNGAWKPRRGAEVNAPQPRRTAPLGQRAGPGSPVSGLVRFAPVWPFKFEGL